MAGATIRARPEQNYGFGLSSPMNCSAFFRGAEYRQRSGMAGTGIYSGQYLLNEIWHPLEVRARPVPGEHPTGKVAGGSRIHDFGPVRRKIVSQGNSLLATLKTCLASEVVIPLPHSSEKQRQSNSSIHKAANEKHLCGQSRLSSYRRGITGGI